MNEAFRSLKDCGRPMTLPARMFSEIVLERKEAHHGLASGSVD